MYFRIIYDKRKFWREGQVKGRGSCRLSKMERGRRGKMMGEKTADN